MYKKLFMLAVAASVAGAAHADFSAPYPSSSSSVIASVGDLGSSYGYFWSASRGDMVSESWTGTGEMVVNALDLHLNVPENVLNSGATVEWDVLVNSTLVGSFSVIEGYFGDLDLTFNFSPIAGLGDYTVTMEVTNDVPGGFGSHTLDHTDSSMTLYTAVPEPTSMAALGLGALALLRRRRAR